MNRLCALVAEMNRLCALVAEMNRLCAMVEDKCLNHFKNILKTREVQSTLDRFLTSLLAKRQKPATEEEETYLEQTLKI